jgi:drug/metabolite transporter (DMT)-like permease
MARLLIILLIGLTFDSTGVVLLKMGMTRIGDVTAFNRQEIQPVLKAGVVIPQILLGVFCEALFFVSLLVLMAKSDISFLWPLTGLSFVFATLAAMAFLGERVSVVRWAGVVLIMLGAVLISYSEHSKPKPPAVSSPAAANL